MYLVGLDCSDVLVDALLVDAEGDTVATGSCRLHETDNPGPAIRPALQPLLPHLSSADTAAVVALPQGFRVDRDELARLLAPLLERSRQVWRCSPMEAIAAGALNARPGLVVHCALRASAIGIHADGRLLTGGHADTPLGDDGSALWLAVQLLRVVQQGLKGRTPRNTRVERSLTAYFGSDSFEALLQNLEAGAIPAIELAGCTSVILQLATYPDPDPACRVLVLQAARHLISLARYVIEQSGFGDDLLVGTWSGTSLDGPLRETFMHSADTEVPEIRWQPPVHSAAQGCTMLALACAREATGLSGLRPPAGADGAQTASGLRPPAGADGAQTASGLRPPAGADEAQTASGLRPPAGADEAQTASGLRPPAGADEAQTASGADMQVVTPSIWAALFQQPTPWRQMKSPP